MPGFSIQREKLDQAVAILNRQNVDCWLTLVSESRLVPDPALDLILNLEETWLSAFIVAKNGKRIALVGRFDAQGVRQMGGYTQVIAYDQDPFPDLLKVLEALDPQTIALNYSENDNAADGLSHGLWLWLTRNLAGTRFADRLISAENIITSLRGQKSPGEIQRVRQAVHKTETIVDEITQKIKTDMTEMELYEMVQGLFKKHGVVPSWNPCPNVTVGPNSVPGHSLPEGSIRVKPGMLVHMDLGVVENEYVSDIQRVWYVLNEGESTVTEAVQKGFNDVRGAILAAAEALKPGVEGWQVDAVARDYITSHGWPEYKHALGHHVGRSVHDGAGVLGPRWPRYGKAPYAKVEPGNIFTLELEVAIPGYGMIGLEEDVLVTDEGLEWLSTPQMEIMLIGSSESFFATQE